MNFLAALLLGVHILAVLGVLLMLLIQASRETKSVSSAILHSLWTAVIAGVALAGIDHKDLNYGALGFKVVVLSVIMTLGYKAKAENKLKNSTWLLMIVLTVINILVASMFLTAK